MGNLQAERADDEHGPVDQFGMPVGFDYYADADREYAADAAAHIEPGDPEDGPDRTPPEPEGEVE
jgi:hypothetical protein